MIRRLWIALGPIAFALVAGVILLLKLFGHQETRFEHAALEAQTSAQMATYRGAKIHGIDLPDVPPVLQAWKKRGSHPFVLLVIVFLRPIQQFIYFQF